ncbi:hypothetical protein [Ferruginibacter sp.]|uniref:hypothetical protein n=1 Tax=Ferruginibacter sp. TaxID=1940288 RepID=UPI001986ACBD|nr:hypothetical protein [Ferruginibacter sp.]MBC7626157.1 hypothetical protein [Ferruginibacter sp.]
MIRISFADLNIDYFLPILKPTAFQEPCLSNISLFQITQILELNCNSTFFQHDTIATGYGTGSIKNNSCLTLQFDSIAENNRMDIVKTKIIYLFEEGRKTTAISYNNLSGTGESNRPVSPCGMCRQSLAEYEERIKQPIRLILSGMEGKIIIIESAAQLLPLSFGSGDMK